MDAKDVLRRLYEAAEAFVVVEVGKEKQQLCNLCEIKELNAALLEARLFFRVENQYPEEVTKCDD